MEEQRDESVAGGTVDATIEGEREGERRTMEASQVDGGDLG